MLRFPAENQLITEPCAPVRQLRNTTCTGDLLSVCMMLLHALKDIPAGEKLCLANRVVAEHIASCHP